MWVELINDYSESIIFNIIKTKNCIKKIKKHTTQLNKLKLKVMIIINMFSSVSLIQYACPSRYRYLCVSGPVSLQPRVLTV